MVKNSFSYLWYNVVSIVQSLDLHDILIFTQTTTAYLNAETEEDQKKTFSSLHWGRKYCVSIKVEGKGAADDSKVSPQQCLQLPEQGKKNIMMMMHR